jgi:NADPH:quinone reductase-like Zn-dependent oxidoreductase
MRFIRFGVAALAMCVAAQAAPEKMRGVQVGEGAALSVQEMPVPRPGAGEVLIKVRSAAVNPVDWKIASRRVGQVPGTDVAGVIDTAGVPIAAETAYRALHEAGKLQKGQIVLIHGAAGGVGSAAVQIAKAAGARVIGTASSSNHDFLKSLGVDEVIDYRTQKFEELVKNVDLVLNTANAETNARSIGIVREGGTLVSIVGPPDAATCASARIRCVRPDRDTGASNAEMLARIGELADAGKFKVFVDGVYPMADAQKAWEKSREGHARGKLIIQVSAGPTMKHQ